MNTEKLLKVIKSKLGWKKLTVTPATSLYLDSVNYQKLLYELEDNIKLSSTGFPVYLGLEVFKVETLTEHVNVH